VVWDLEPTNVVEEGAADSWVPVLCVCAGAVACFPRGAQGVAALGCAEDNAPVECWPRGLPPNSAVGCGQWVGGCCILVARVVPNFDLVSSSFLGSVESGAHVIDRLVDLAQVCLRLSARTITEVDWTANNSGQGQIHRGDSYPGLFGV
jgi:hypothetical protein